VEIRFTALYFLVVNIHNTKANQIATFIEDKDERVQNFAIMALPQFGRSLAKQDLETIEIPDTLQNLLIDQLKTAPKKAKIINHKLWPSTKIRHSISLVADALVTLKIYTSPEELLPFKKQIGPDNRYWLLSELIKRKPWSAACRSEVISSVGDLSDSVSQLCCDALKKETMSDDEICAIEALLSRKNTSLRSNVVSLLLRQDDERVFESVNRLLADTKAPKVDAGLELLRQMAEKDRERSRCIASTRSWIVDRKLSKVSKNQVDAILRADQEEFKLSNGLGLLNNWVPPDRYQPTGNSSKLVTENALEIILNLNRIMLEKEHLEIESSDSSGETTIEIFSNTCLMYPYFETQREHMEKRFERLPLSSTWKDWYENNGHGELDLSEQEIWRALQLVSLMHEKKDNEIRGIVAKIDEEFVLPDYADQDLTIPEWISINILGLLN